MEPHPNYWYDRKGKPISVQAAEELFHDIVARRVALDIVDGWRVSTVHMVVDHNVFGDGPPLIFETMVFDGSGEPVTEDRTATEEQARVAHQRAVAEVPALQDCLANHEDPVE